MPSVGTGGFSSKVVNVDEGEDGGLVGLYTENEDGVFNL